MNNVISNESETSQVILLNHVFPEFISKKPSTLKEAESSRKFQNKKAPKKGTNNEITARPTKTKDDIPVIFAALGAAAKAVLLATFS